MNEIEEYLPTMVSRGEETEKFKFTNELLERDTVFKIRGLEVERSIEDRDVYIQIESKDNTIEQWLRGENAIELGEALIRQGRYALIANMYHRNRILCYQKLKEYIDKGIVNKIILDYLKDEDTHKNESCYGVFRIKIEVNKEKMKELYDEYLHELILDFNFKDILSPEIYYSDFINLMEKRFFDIPVCISNLSELYEDRKFVLVYEPTSVNNIEERVDTCNITSMYTTLVNFDENKAPLSGVIKHKHVMIRYKDIDKLKGVTKILLYSKKSMSKKYGQRADKILNTMVEGMCCGIDVDELEADKFNKLIQDIKTHYRS